MNNEENIDEQIAKATRHASRQATVNILSTEFLPPQSENGRQLERWMKISLAKLCDKFSETLVIPTIGFSSLAKTILGKKSTHSVKLILDALMSTRNLSRISSEKRLIEQNILMLQHIKQYSTQNSWEKLTRIYPELSSRRIIELTKLYEKKLLKKIVYTAEKTSAFILDCKSLGISENEINENYKEYAELFDSELEALIKKTIDICLSGEDIDKLSELPETLVKPVGPRIIEHNGCSSSMSFSLPWQPKPFAINTRSNNMLDEKNNPSGSTNEMLDEENKENIKFNHIR